MSFLGIRRFLPLLFRPATEALFTWGLPWQYRWRMLLLQPLTMMTFAMTATRWLRTKAYTVEYIEVSPGRVLRALVFRAAGAGTGLRGLRPLHVDIHGGAFMGGWPEEDAVFCDQLARETGAVVISVQYRYAPKHPFPAAHDDIDAAIRYIKTHAEAKYGADPSLLTVSGFSAGGNLAIAAAQADGCGPTSPTGIKASATFYASIDLRLKPQEKPKPKNYPNDPFAFLLPLFDCYAAPVRTANMANQRMSPMLAGVDQLPENMLLVVPGIDILCHEQMTFVERVREELGKGSKYVGRKVEVVEDEKGFHGYLNLPDSVIAAEWKQKAFGPATRFIKDVHGKYGFEWRS